jgi:hypothetical protein
LRYRNGPFTFGSMEYRTLALLVVLVLAVAAWAIFSPKPTSINDPAWDCPTHGKASTWSCVKKHG